jgi:hypothetical protein
MKLLRLFNVLYFAILIGGCSTHPTIPQGPVSDGFQFFSSARSFDPPGRVYRVDPTGQIYGVTKLEIDPIIGDEVLPKIKTKETLSLKALLKTLNLPIEKLALSSDLDLNSTVEVNIQGSDAIREYLDDDVLDYILPKALSQINIRTDNKYYVIRETISSKNIEYTFNKGKEFSSNTEATLKEIAQGNIDLSWESTNVVTMKRSLDKPLRIWYKPELLKIVQPFGVAPGKTLRVTRMKLSNNEVLKLPPNPKFLP